MSTIHFATTHINRGRIIKYLYVLRKVGNHLNGQGIQQYIKDGSKLKQKLTYHLFNSMLRGRKYLEYVLRKEGNYPDR